VEDITKFDILKAEHKEIKTAYPFLNLNSVLHTKHMYV